jgi:hypothetical protein
MSEPQRSKWSPAASSQSVSGDSSGSKDSSEDSTPRPEPSISDHKDIKRLRLQLKSQVAKHLRASLLSKTTAKKLKATQAAKTTAAAHRLTDVTRRYEAEHFALTL